MKIATWNVNSLRVRLPQVLQWLDSSQPDILALQETKLTDEAFPVAELLDAGYQCAFAGQKTYNGVALLSRQPLTDIVTDLPGLDDPQRRVLGATISDVRVLNLYVPNGQAVGSDKYAYKLEWLAALADYLADQHRQYRQLVVVGDFNIAPDDRDVHDPEAWAGKILCSEPERGAFSGLLATGLNDAFRLFTAEGSHFSWWDYRAAGFRRNLGLRIDHILITSELTERCTGCVIDTEPRRWERPSDHTPVVAEFSDR